MSVIKALASQRQGEYIGKVTIFAGENNTPTTMMRHILCLSLLLMSGISRAASFSVYDLTCDNEVSPVGIDNRQPAFSWKIFSPTRAFVQGAYQLLVADSEEAAAAATAKWWICEVCTPATQQPR